MLKNHITIFFVSALLFFCLGCAEDSNGRALCEPCPTGFQCLETPFGTYDCLPSNPQGASSSMDYDGGYGGAQLTDFGTDLNRDGSTTREGDGALSGDAAYSFDVGEPAEADVSLGPIEDSVALPARDHRPAGGRLVRLDIPTTVERSRTGGCQVVGRNAGSGLAGVLTVLNGDLTSQLQSSRSGRIPLILLSDFLGWQGGQTADAYGSGPLEIYIGSHTDTEAFVIEPNSFIDGQESSVSKMRFLSHFRGAEFTTEVGDFILETSSLGLPFLIELDEAHLAGRVSVSETGLSMVETTLNGYITFASVRRIVFAIQQFCNENPETSFCGAANRFLDGDPSTPELDGDTERIARTVILPLMRNLDVHLGPDGPRPCELSCEAQPCVECNAVSVCVLLESVPALIQ